MPQDILFDIFTSPFGIGFMLVLTYLFYIHFSRPHYVYKNMDAGVWNRVNEKRYYPEEKYEQDLVSFGNYLLSEDRKKMYEDHPEFPNNDRLGERLRQVSHADLSNWKSSK